MWPVQDDSLCEKNIKFLYQLSSFTLKWQQFLVTTSFLSPAVEQGQVATIVGSTTSKHPDSRTLTTSAVAG